LCVQIHQQGTLAAHGQAGPQVNGRRRLAHAAFGITDDNFAEFLSV
jgi:hypothetical protein